MSRIPILHRDEASMERGGSERSERWKGKTLRREATSRVFPSKIIYLWEKF